jgi:hemoglobin/transferrin/lactoferrin receptor protein
VQINRSSFRAGPIARLVAVVLAVSTPLVARAQSPQPTDTVKTTMLDVVTVTATRTPKTVFRTASPVLVVDSTRIRATLPNGPAELFRDSPGMDVAGTGTNQGRPIIRGQRGQRILLLEDGIRLNNSRRQQDFGEIPSLIGLDALDRVEVVRGPASVLYGTDAIGGVINLITARPTYGGVGKRISGLAGYRYSTSDQQRRPSGSAFGQIGRLGFAATGAWREADDYDAPAGHFGNVSLNNDLRVFDTGVRDGWLALQGGYGLSAHHTISAKLSEYTARDAGFGFVENSALGLVDAPRIEIRYPDQSYRKLSAQYLGNALALPVADKIDVIAYSSRNERSLQLGVFVPFGPGTPAGAGVQVDSRNFTDVGTVGFRAEATKTIRSQVLTYGMDFFRDRSNNTDSSVTAVLGFGPPRPQLNDTASTPNAAFSSRGIFAQGDLTLGTRLTAVLGARWQTVNASTRSTPRMTAPLVNASDNTVVGAANLLYRVIDQVHLVASVGRAFRSPNLIERFFKGATPEGAGYQIPNPALEPETSLDVDLGVKIGTGQLYGEAFVFRNDVSNGIRIAPTGTKVGPFNAFQNVNVDRIRDKGVELLGQAPLGRGFAFAGSYTRLSSRDVLNPLNPVGDSYSSKTTGSFGWRAPSGRFWGEYAVRHNGERKDVALGSSPVGPVLPSFTVHALRGGARLFKAGPVSHSVTVAVNNLTNRLYAEFANVSFFRPEPKRTLAVSWTSAF